MTGDQLTFAKRLHDLTGINLGVIFAWVTLENGPGDNPLNVSPGGQVAHFGNPDQAAVQTSSVISRLHASILRAVGKSPTAQLNAIASSGWATDPAYRSKLFNVARSIFPKMKGKHDTILGSVGHAISSSPPGKIAGDVGAAAGDIAHGDVGGALGDLGSAGKTAVTAPFSLAAKLADVLGLSGWVAGLVQGLLAIFVAVVILGLAAALFYNGVRRLSGDRIPSAGDLARAGAKTPVPIPA